MSEKRTDQETYRRNTLAERILLVLLARKDIKGDLNNLDLAKYAYGFADALIAEGQK